jgi:hypothetical protein
MLDNNNSLGSYQFTCALLQRNKLYFRIKTALHTIKTFLLSRKIIPEPDPRCCKKLHSSKLGKFQYL